MRRIALPPRSEQLVLYAMRCHWDHLFASIPTPCGPRGGPLPIVSLDFRLLFAWCL